MPDITLHNLDDATYTAIRNAAEAEDLSLNQVIKRVIRKAAQDKTFGLPVACEPVAVYGQEPNLHLAIDPDLLAKAQSKAAERGTSLLRLVFDSLAAFVEGSVEPPRRVLGTWKGLVHMAPDFNELPADIAEAFGMENGGEE